MNPFEAIDTDGWRFSLRTLLIWTLIAAFASFNWKFFFSLGIAAQKDLIFWTIALALGTFAWNTGQSGPPLLSARSRREQILARIFLVLFAICTLYLLWVRIRWQMLTWKTSPRDYFPYPDSWLAELHEWFDRRYPAGEYIKIRGEVGRVYIVVNYSAWLAATMMAFIVGLLFRVDRMAILGRIRKFVAHLLRLCRASVSLLPRGRG